MTTGGGSGGSSGPADRLWRARRRHDHIDAEIVATPAGCELRYLRNDRVMVVWRFDTPEAAADDARARLADLIRAGWTVHW